MPLANALTTEVGFKVGPILLEVLAKHYLERLTKESHHDEPKLRQDNILYGEAFSIVKTFLNAASWHTVEDLQAFSNTRTPSPPWIHVVRTIIPMSSCDQAASHLIKVLGGEDMCRKVVGGNKWWQVRGINGVDAQWIAAKKDWREAKRRHKQRGEAYPSDSPKEDGAYVKDMDAMRCILYLHGGGYYFGSVDQERYSIQRLARKISGRVFAINYRLAPQYPFPCAIQDALASYLYLIRPPPGAEHQPVDPAHIVIAGDSAGGGLSLALLQVIRDCGLPSPAGGLLISPWCDLTHSFPSIHTNTKTDVVPDCGLSWHKPSTLWPPPSPEVSDRVHASIRHRVRQVFRVDSQPEQTDTIVAEPHDQHPDTTGLPFEVGSTTSVPPLDANHSENIERIRIVTGSETLEVDNQIHFYTRNCLLVHPLVSPALSYLGDLPPLFFVASEKEVLRDEIIYTAHRAADPSKFPVKQVSQDLYPPLKDISDMKPTSVHLQVYDDTAHVLPILFAFTTPAKFCFRAMASFCKLVTGIPLSPPASASPTSASFVTDTAEEQDNTNATPSRRTSISLETANANSGKRRMSAIVSSSPSELPPSRPSLRRAISSRISRAGTLLPYRRHSAIFGTTAPPSGSEGMDGNDTQNPNPQGNPDRTRGATTSSDVAGPRFNFSKAQLPPSGTRLAGEVSVYSSIKDLRHWESGIIRERVSTEGVIRPLEVEEDLDGMKMPEEFIGRISELALRRYLDTQQTFTKKYSHTYKQIEKQRRRNLERSKQDTIKRMSKIRKTMKGRNDSNGGTPHGDYTEYLLSSPGWTYAWALDEDEHPPPSSLAARRDTEEARRLAEFADLAILGGDRSFSGNNLWSIMINFFTVTPDTSKAETDKPPEEEKAPSGYPHRSIFSKLLKPDFHRHRHDEEKSPST